jgi:hypothetical protein
MSNRKCLFCENSANTREHVWPDWIIRSLGPQEPIRRTGVDGSVNEFSGSLTVKCVCDDCNNGWMSLLENKVRTFLDQVLHNQPTSLDLEQQKLLSLWAVKTAMVIEALKAKFASRCYLRSDCELLRTQSVIPGRTKVWIGKFYKSNLLVLGTDLGIDNMDTIRGGRVSITTIVAGHLVLQIVHARFSAELNNTPINIPYRGGPWEELLVSVWPPKEVVKWPPAKLFINDGGSHSLGRLPQRWEIY